MTASTTAKSLPALVWLGLAAIGAAQPGDSQQAFAANGLVSHYTVARADDAINIDGRLSEFPWAAAAQINGFQRILHDYGQVTRPTRARMLWDDEFFYFAFACQDPDMWAIYEREDDKLWEEEVVEVFIDPDGDGRDYLELEVNPLNAVVDLVIVRLEPEWESDLDWDIAGLRSAIQVHGTVNDSLDHDQGWTVEIAIPWAAMVDRIGGGGRPEPGDTWRLNLYRIERKAGREAMGEIRSLHGRLAQLKSETGVESVDELGPELREKGAQLQKQLSLLTERYHGETEYTAWSETHQRGFHHPERFGVVQFMGDRRNEPR